MRKYWGCEMDSPIYRQIIKEKSKIKVKTNVKKRGKNKAA